MKVSIKCPCINNWTFTIENILGILKFHRLRKFVDFEDNPVSVIRLDLLFIDRVLYGTRRNILGCLTKYAQRDIR